MTGPDGRGGHFRSIPVASVIARKKKRVRTRIAPRLNLVGEDGFEPSKLNATDLQSAPFGHSGTLPYKIVNGAGGRTRTPDLLITNQLLYQLSYTSECDNGM